jgi:hypothetical protein
MSYHQAMTERSSAASSEKPTVWASLGALWTVISSPRMWRGHGLRILRQLVAEVRLSSEVRPHLRAAHAAERDADRLQSRMWIDRMELDNAIFDSLMQTPSKYAALIEGWRVDPQTDKALWTEFARVLRGLNIVSGARLRALRPPVPDFARPHNSQRPPRMSWSTDPPT